MFPNGLLRDIDISSSATRSKWWLFFVCHWRPLNQTPNYREIRISGQASAEQSVVPHWPSRRSNHAIIQRHFRRPPVAHGKSLRYPPFCDSRSSNVGQAPRRPTNPKVVSHSQFAGCHGWLAHPCWPTAGRASSGTRRPTCRIEIP